MALRLQSPCGQNRSKQNAHEMIEEENSSTSEAKSVPFRGVSSFFEREYGIFQDLSSSGSRTR